MNGEQARSLDLVAMIVVRALERLEREEDVERNAAGLPSPVSASPPLSPGVLPIERDSVEVASMFTNVVAEVVTAAIASYVDPHEVHHLGLTEQFDTSLRGCTCEHDLEQDLLDQVHELRDPGCPATHSGALVAITKGMWR